MDDRLPYELADGLVMPDAVALVTTAESPDAKEHLARIEARAVVLRPDRYTLGTADTRGELVDLIATVLPCVVTTS